MSGALRVLNAARHMGGARPRLVLLRSLPRHLLGARKRGSDILLEAGSIGSRTPEELETLRRGGCHSSGVCACTFFLNL